MMTIEEIRTGKEGQTFDLKSIQIDPKALAIPIGWYVGNWHIRQDKKDRGC